MIPLPDWNRLRPRPQPQSTGRGGGCGDFSGCALGCGGVVAVIVLTLSVANLYGIWAALVALVVLILIVNGLTHVSKVVAGVLLGGFFAVGVWFLMKQDYAHKPGWIITDAILAFGLFSLAGYWEQKRQS